VRRLGDAELRALSALMLFGGCASYTTSLQTTCVSRGPMTVNVYGTRRYTRAGSTAVSSGGPST
jgi:hypothetical protein